MSARAGEDDAANAVVLGGRIEPLANGSYPIDGDPPVRTVFSIRLPSALPSAQ